MILVTCALYSFLGNTALLGPSVYIGIFSQEFGISPNTASGLISYANLVFGFGEHRRRRDFRVRVNADLDPQARSCWCPCIASLAAGP